MTWQAEIDELHLRADMARQMGGPESVAFHKGRGKLTVRERLDILADPGTFAETGVLAGKATYEGRWTRSTHPCEFGYRCRQDRWPEGHRPRWRLHDPGRFGRWFGCRQERLGGEAGVLTEVAVHPLAGCHGRERPHVRVDGPHIPAGERPRARYGASPDGALRIGGHGFRRRVAGRAGRDVSLQRDGERHKPALRSQARLS